ncbi:8042_t:CDS:2 [Dentiscutata erythropus]|uniref:8042_t:CDS:1 n=1 Tax=Dentiscutata erythropus TaxID=1348616 RepID=A0A9N9DI08_9GLOM|nr:8042_t:CDS:2 [Dentiscutata erythropus]
MLSSCSSDNWFSNESWLPQYVEKRTNAILGEDQTIIAASMICHIGPEIDTTEEPRHD